MLLYFFIAIYALVSLSIGVWLGYNFWVKRNYKLKTRLIVRFIFSIVYILINAYLIYLLDSLHVKPETVVSSGQYNVPITITGTLICIPGSAIKPDCPKALFTPDRTIPVEFDEAASLNGLPLSKKVEVSGLTNDLEVTIHVKSIKVL